MNALVIKVMLNKLTVPTHAFLIAWQDARTRTAPYPILAVVTRVIPKTNIIQISACPNVLKAVKMLSALLRTCVLAKKDIQKTKKQDSACLFVMKNV
jgi:hypothetical protein